MSDHFDETLLNETTTYLELVASLESMSPDEGKMFGSAASESEKKIVKQEFFKSCKAHC